MAARIVIVGGGFGGAWCARRLERRLGDRVDVLLLDRNNYFIFYPLLVEAGTNALESRHVVVRQRDFVRKARFRMAEVVDVDLDRREVLHRVGGDGRLRRASYDHLVLAPGSVTSLPPVPGLAEHAWEIKSIADAIALQDRAIRMLELADATEDEAKRRALLHFVVVGASFTGAELAGEYHAFLQRTARQYPRLDPRECRMTLVERAGRILPALDARLAEYATRQMRSRGIRILLERSVASVEAGRVTLDDGEVLEARTTVWCAGVAPPPLTVRLDLPKVAGGWIDATPDLRVRGRDDVWALGDTAHNPDPDGEPYPATAQHAIRQGDHLADNIAAVLRGEATRPCEIQSAGTLAPLGCRTAVAHVLGIRISGFLAWWFFRTVYLLKMPGWGRKLRILADWNLNLVLPRQAVQLGVAPSWATRPPRRLDEGPPRA